MPWQGLQSHAEARSLCESNAKPGNLRQADETTNFGRRCPSGAELAQARGPGRFRQLSPGIIKDETVMPVGRLRQPEQLLQQPMH
jgi:hypothetical protein